MGAILRIYIQLFGDSFGIFFYNTLKCLHRLTIEFIDWSFHSDYCQ